jgi:hypothetical protein
MALPNGRVPVDTLYIASLGHLSLTGDASQDIHEVSGEKNKDALKGLMNKRFGEPNIPFRASVKVTSCILPLHFSFDRSPFAPGRSAAAPAFCPFALSANAMQR